MCPDSGWRLREVLSHKRESLFTFASRLISLRAMKISRQGVRALWLS